MDKVETGLQVAFATVSLLAAVLWIKAARIPYAKARTILNEQSIWNSRAAIASGVDALLGVADALWKFYK
jgi:hypothetical protein